MKKKVATIENRWDILYRDYPEIYDKFAKVKKSPSVERTLPKIFSFRNKKIVDVGSGTGESTFAFAPYAREVIGVEPEEGMSRIAIKNLKNKKFENVTFLNGSSSNIPLPNKSVDFVVAVTCASFYKAKNIKQFVKEAKRVLVKNGFIISVDVAPGWYGGELAPVILGRTRRERGSDSEVVRNETFTTLGFDYKDFYQKQKYGSLKKIISTYGFIFGKKAINYLISRKKTSIKWKFRIYYKKV